MSPYDTGGAYGKRGLSSTTMSTTTSIPPMVVSSLVSTPHCPTTFSSASLAITATSTSAVRRGDTGGGSWNPNGYGGGHGELLGRQLLRARCLWCHAGQSRHRETYTATKDTTSYMGTVRVGAPFAWGGLILEPQATAIWNGNEDASYTESGKYRAFALKLNSYSDNFLRTALGAKLAWPIKQGERKLIVPNIKAAWLADWDTNNGAVKFNAPYTRRGRKARTAEIPSNQETQYGVLLKAASTTPSPKAPPPPGSSMPKVAPSSGSTKPPTGAPQAASPSSSDQNA